MPDVSAPESVETVVPCNRTSASKSKGDSVAETPMATATTLDAIITVALWLERCEHPADGNHRDRAKPSDK